MSMSRADFRFVLTGYVKSRKCRSLASYLSGSRQHGFLHDVFSIGLLKACQIGNCQQQESLSFSTGSNICLLFYLSQYLSSFLLDCDLLILEIHPAVELHRPHMNIVSLHLCPPYQLKVCIDESIVSCLQQRRDLPCLLGKFSVFVQMQSQSHTPFNLISPSAFKTWSPSGVTHSLYEMLIAAMKAAFQAAARTGIRVVFLDFCHPESTLNLAL